MSAYIVATVAIEDPETYKKYTAKTPALVAKHGGKFIARGGDVETLEGEQFKDRLVIIEFPSSQALQGWYNDPEYQEALLIRQSASQGRVLAVEGC